MKLQRWRGGSSQKLLYLRIPQFLAKRLTLRIHMLNVPMVIFFPRHIRKINNEKEVVFPQIVQMSKNIATLLSVIVPCCLIQAESSFLVSKHWKYVWKIERNLSYFQWWINTMMVPVLSYLFSAKSSKLKDYIEDAKN